jgi:origin recognition complex subunit 4
VSGVSKLRGLPHPALGVLIVAKHLAYAGRAEFSFAQVEDEYLRFARTRLIGSGRTRWPPEVLRKGFDLCRTLGLLAPAGPATAVPRFAKFRATITPHEVVAFFRGEGSNLLGPELGGWGKLSGGHA